MKQPGPSLRIQDVQSPVIPHMGSLIRQHPGSIGLGQGMVGYSPPPQILDAAREALSGQPWLHAYQHAAGLPALRQAFREKLSRENGLQDPGEETSTLVTAGSNMGFHHVVQAITDPGDEIILLSPFYFNQEMSVRIAGCRPVLVDTDSFYQPDPDRIRKSITARTRAVVTISPNNPTGAVYSGEMVRAINDLCGQRGLYHIHDEAYEYFLYDGTEHASPLSFGGNRAFTIGLHSMSKAFGMAGWRIGFLTVPRALEASILKIQDTVLINPTILSQHLALAALQAGAGYCRQFLPELSALRAIFRNALQGQGFLPQLVVPQGAFYFLLQPRIPLDSLTCAERLIREFGVGVIPGHAFGCSDCALRISFGSIDSVSAEEGMKRLVAGLGSLARRNL